MIFQTWFYVLLFSIPAVWLVWGLRKDILKQIEYKKERKLEQKIPAFIPKTNMDSGYTIVCLDGNFSMDNFFTAEALLRKKVSFTYRWNFLSKLNAFGEAYIDLYVTMDRKFIYKESRLMLSYNNRMITIYPQAKEKANKEDNSSVVEISRYIIVELNNLIAKQLSSEEIDD